MLSLFQLEAKKNTLENVLNNNLKRKRDELKQVCGGVRRVVQTRPSLPRRNLKTRVLL